MNGLNYTGRITTMLMAMVAVAVPAYGQAVKSVVTASNGVEVTVYTDDFANRKEFSSPYAKAETGQVMVAAITKSGVTTPIQLSGFFVYSGGWRRYNSALFRGGDPAKFISTGREVGSCSSSRYSRPSCTLIENFAIELTPAEIRQYGETGSIDVQVRAEDTSTVIFSIPITYFKAVAEIAKVNLDPPPPPPPPAVAAPAPKPAVKRPVTPVKRKR